MPVVSLSTQSSLNGFEVMEEITSMEDEYYLSEDYSKYDKPEKYRRKIKNRMRELRICERIYVAQLEKLVEFCNTFRETSYTLSLDNACTEPREDIKNKIHQMHEFHAQFLQELESHENDLSSLASAFVEHTTDFAMYYKYEEIHEKYLASLKEPDKVDRTIQENFLEPKRRLPLYFALLSELLKYNKKYQHYDVTAQEDFARHDDELQAAIDSFKSTLNKINISRRIGEINGCQLPIYEQGSLIRNDEFKVSKNKYRTADPLMCILFEKMLVFAEVNPESKDIKNNLNFVDAISLSDENTEINLSERVLTVVQHYKGETLTKFTLKTETIATIDDWSYVLNLLLDERFVKNA